MSIAPVATKAISAGPHTITMVLNHLVDGGAARVASHLAWAWTGMGRRVTILTSDDGSRPSLYPIPPQAAHRPLALQNDSFNLAQALLNNLRRLRRLRRALLESSPDLIVSFLDSNNVMCLLATRAARRIPIIISERTDPFERSIGPAWERLRRFTYPWADCLVAQTPRALSYFSAGVQARGAVIPNPVAAFPRGPGDGPAKLRKQILALGRLQKVKGHDLLMDAFARVAGAFPGWDLYIYGEGPEREALCSRITALSLTGRAFLPGNTTDVPARLREADLFVLPSRAEGFPNALAEAMAAGLPVISFNCPSGPSELIRHEVDGLLVPPQDANALATAMARLMGDPAARARLAARAVEVLDRFSLERILGLWEAAIHRVCAPR